MYQTWPCYHWFLCFFKTTQSEWRYDFRFCYHSPDLWCTFAKVTHFVKGPKTWNCRVSLQRDILIHVTQIVPLYLKSGLFFSAMQFYLHGTHLVHVIAYKHTSYIHKRTVFSISFALIVKCLWYWEDKCSACITIAIGYMSHTTTCFQRWVNILSAAVRVNQSPTMRNKF